MFKMVEQAFFRSCLLNTNSFPGICRTYIPFGKFYDTRIEKLRVLPG
jgi:hypothetical protein